MSEDIRKQIDMFNNIILSEGKRVDLNKKYGNVLFSDDFYNQDEAMVNYRKDLYLGKIDNFINFYRKYTPKGVRIFNGVDLYMESKSIFNKVVNGELYIDEVFSDPDNPLRNIVMLLHIDEPKLNKRMNE